MKQEMIEFYEALEDLVEKAKEVKKMKASLMSGTMGQRRRRRRNGQYRAMGGGGGSSSGGSMGQRFWDDDDFDDDDEYDTMY